jgi:hypothetical protein
VFAGISIEITERKIWNNLDGTNSESKDCDPTPSEKVTSKETQISLENLSVRQTELASKSIIQHIVAMNTTTYKIKEKKKFQTITGILYFPPPSQKYITIKNNLKWYSPQRLNIDPITTTILPFSFTLNVQHFAHHTTFLN